jgi:hypothetical protein
MNEPAIPATWFRPRARPRSLAGKASVRIALELAISMAPPTPCRTRIRISHQAAAVPCSQVSDRATENNAKTAKPRLYIRTRPNMSPSRPKLTTSTAVTTRYPMSSQSRRLVLPGCNGLTPMQPEDVRQADQHDGRIDGRHQDAERGVGQGNPLVPGPGARRGGRHRYPSGSGPGRVARSRPRWCSPRVS